MLNPRCPNCSYVLVLLSNRWKYKCSKCGRLFYQREAEDKTFRDWNKKQREMDKHNLIIELYHFTILKFPFCSPNCNTVLKDIPVKE